MVNLKRMVAEDLLRLRSMWTPWLLRVQGWEAQGTLSMSEMSSAGWEAQGTLSMSEMSSAAMSQLSLLNILRQIPLYISHDSSLCLFKVGIRVTSLNN